MSPDDRIAIRHLLLALKDPKLVESEKPNNILNNIVYFVPRISNIEELRELVNAVVSWNPQYVTIWEWFQTFNLILRWKLEISEPRISLKEFLLVWNDEIIRLKSWNVYQLTALAGFLSCRDQLERLHENIFIDDSGNSVVLMDKWKHAYFLPIWKEYVRIHPKDPILLQDLCVIYSMVHSSSDKNLPFDSVFVHLLTIIVEYIERGSFTSKDKRSEFFSSHFNIICQVCADCVQHLRDDETLMDSLSKLHVTLRNFSESSEHHQKDRYNDRFYLNVLFSVVLLLSGLTPTVKILQVSIYCLFDVSFILEDFGVDGFTKYQDLIHSMCALLVKDFQLYDNVLVNMLQLLRKNPENKMQHAKMMFVLQFLEITLIDLEFPNVEYLQNRFVPFISPLLQDTDIQVRESAHLVWLAIYSNESWSNGIVTFKLENIRPYLLMSMDQYSKGLMSDKQLIEIWKHMALIIKRLSPYDKDLVRTLLHTTYLMIINTENTTFRSIFIQCLIEQFYNVKDRYLCEWLETVYELIESLPSSNKNSILTKLWQFVSHSHNELAIRWWYDRVIPTLSRI